ncbi:MAG: hypothetical protein ITG02_04640 [Patulibacter sp.]|nr:hypothetical protein [Patulibacter sp.]
MRAERSATAEWLILAVGVVLALIVWALFPSSGNYDTVLDLVWARELLDGRAPGFEAYAASTPHPAWLAIGVPVVALFGEHADRAMVLLTALTLPVLAAATVRLGRIAGEAVTGPGADDGAAPASAERETFDGSDPHDVSRRDDAARAARTGLVVGLIAGGLTLTSFAFLLLAAKGYLDMPFLALVAWAGVWAIEKPTAWRGPAVLLLLAGLLRPEAWVLAGLYWLWCTVGGRWSARGAPAPPTSARGVLSRGGTEADEVARAEGRTASTARAGGRALHLATVLAAPLLWMAVDAAVTGNPFHSLTATSQLADELGRERGIARAPKLLVTQLVDQARPPVAAAGLLGLAVLLLGWRIGLARPPRRVVVVLLTLLLAGVATFLAAGVAGLSLIPRYLSVPVVALTVLAALAAGGWVALPSGHRWRRPWAVLVLVGAVVGVGAYLTVKRDSVRSLGSELRFLADAREDVRELMEDPAVVAGSRCGPISLPTYRLVPEIRLQLDLDGDRVVARSDPRAAALGAFDRGVAISVTEGKFARRYGRADGVPRSTQAVPPGFVEVARRGAFVASVRCR